jgi:hypothetical protein
MLYDRISGGINTMIDWQSVALALFAIVNTGLGCLIKRLIEQVDKLATCVAKQGEWRNMHDKRHDEMRTDRINSERDLWDAVNEASRGSGRGQR